MTIRERQLRLQHQSLEAPVVGATDRTRRPLLVGVGIGAVLIVTSAYVVWQRSSTQRVSSSSTGVVHRERRGDLEVIVASPSGGFRQGRNAFTIEFRDSAGALVNVGTVRATANMTMPGMAMSSGMQVQPGGTPGRYEATAEFGMAGAWPISVQWDGPKGRDSISFEGPVQ